MSSPLSWAFNIINILHTHNTHTSQHSQSHTHTHAHTIEVYIGILYIFFISTSSSAFGFFTISVCFAMFRIVRSASRQSFQCLAACAIRFVCQRHRRHHRSMASALDLIPFWCFESVAAHTTIAQRPAKRRKKNEHQKCRLQINGILVLNFTSICSYASMCLPSLCCFLFYSISFAACIARNQCREK